MGEKFHIRVEMRSAPCDKIKLLEKFDAVSRLEIGSKSSLDLKFEAISIGLSEIFGSQNTGSGACVVQSVKVQKPEDSGASGQKKAEEVGEPEMVIHETRVNTIKVDTNKTMLCHMPDLLDGIINTFIVSPLKLIYDTEFMIKLRELMVLFAVKCKKRVLGSSSVQFLARMVAGKDQLKAARYVTKLGQMVQCTVTWAIEIVICIGALLYGPAKIGSFLWDWIEPFLMSKAKELNFPFSILLHSINKQSSEAKKEGEAGKEQPGVEKEKASKESEAAKEQLGAGKKVSEAGKEQLGVEKAGKESEAAKEPLGVGKMEGVAGKEQLGVEKAASKEKEAAKGPLGLGKMEGVAGKEQLGVEKAASKGREAEKEASKEQSGEAS